MGFIRKNLLKAGETLSQPIIDQLSTLGPLLEIIKTIREVIIHDGKEPMITFASLLSQIRITRSSYKRDESLLQDLLEIKTLDYPMLPYLQHVTRMLFRDIERMGVEIIKFFIGKDDPFVLK